MPSARGKPPALFDKIIIENIVTYYGIECKAEEDDNAVRRLRIHLISVTLCAEKRFDFGLRSNREQDITKRGKGR
jgi:hypothetical protein